MKYNKLVRDRIPEIIERNGDKAITHVADDGEYQNKLREKLKEEVNEFVKDGNEKELVDILEVVYAIGELKNISKDKFESLRKTKAEERGGFKKRIILDETK
jgi:predicted house-cleaning noncanonical NTP pyrophosphatase (MazG superfamily)